MAENNGYAFKSKNETETESDVFGSDTIRLKIVSRSDTVADIKCSSVQLYATDSQKGTGGGGFGVYPNCIKSVIRLCRGNVTAFNGEKMIFETEISGGFAAVDNNTVTVILD